MSDYKLLFRSGAYPRCYKPYPPFYNICVTGTKLMSKEITSSYDHVCWSKCDRCIREHEFIGYERLEAMRISYENLDEELVNENAQRTPSPPPHWPSIDDILSNNGGSNE